jgi:hypothetical protein
MLSARDEAGSRSAISRSREITCFIALMSYPATKIILLREVLRNAIVCVEFLLLAGLLIIKNVALFSNFGDTKIFISGPRGSAAI